MTSAPAMRERADTAAIADGAAQLPAFRGSSARRSRTGCGSSSRPSPSFHSSPSRPSSTPEPPSEREGEEGVAALTAQLLLEGAAGLDGAALTDRFERIGASVDAHADWDAAIVSLTALTEPPARSARPRARSASRARVPRARSGAAQGRAPRRAAAASRRAGRAGRRAVRARRVCADGALRVRRQPVRRRACERSRAT